MAAFQGSQLVNILSAPTNSTPTGQDPFPPIGSITSSDMFPTLSPSPQFMLVSQTIQGAYLPSAKQLAAFPTAGAVVNVHYWTGNQQQSGIILTTQTPTTIQASF